MLLAHTPALFGASKFLAPALANGNDSYVVSLLHFDAPEGLVSTVGYVPKDYAYGAPSRRDAWTTAAGGMQPLLSYPFNQVGFFGANTIIQCPDAPDLTPTAAGDFTIDFWFAYNSTSVVGDILGKRNPYGPYLFQQNGTSMLFYSSSNGTSWDIAAVTCAGPGIALNTWYHFAAVKQGSTWKFYINGGLQAATVTSALQPIKNAEPLRIGGISGSFAQMYMDEVRISNGIARWTSGFTPPNQPYHARLDLGGNDDATKMLLHFDGTSIVDSAASMNAPKRAFYNGGATLIGTPSNPALTLNALQIAGGSQRLMTVDNSDLAMMRGNFTLDFMYYRTANNGGHIISRRNSNASMTPFLIHDQTNGGIGFYGSTDNTNWNIASNVTLATGIALTTWYHMALVRNGSDLAFYVNGVRTYTQNIGATIFMYTPNDWFDIGGVAEGSGSMLFEEIRYSDVARWTGNFTPPVSGGAAYGPAPTFPYDPYSVLLLHFDATNPLLDFSPNKHGVGTPAGSAGVTGAQSKFGGASFYNPGNGYLTFPVSRDWEFYSSDFTVDWWEYRTSAAGCAIARDLGTTYCPFLLSWSTLGEIYMTSTGSSWDIANGAAGLPSPSFGPPVVGAWSHLAVTRNGSTFRAFRDGVQKSTWTSTLNIIGNGNALCIGSGQNTNYFNGYIDELRISKGIARWTAPFTPPTAPYS